MPLTKIELGQLLKAVEYMSCSWSNGNKYINANGVEDLLKTYLEDPTTTRQKLEELKKEQEDTSLDQFDHDD